MQVASELAPVALLKRPGAHGCGVTEPAGQKLACGQAASHSGELWNSGSVELP